MAQYPSGTPTFTTKINGDVIQPNHINDLQAEITALGNALLTGIPHALIPDITNTRDLGTALKKWRDLHAAGTVHAGAGEFSGSVNVGGNVTAGGDVIAGPGGSFVGDASGLTGVPAGDKSLDQLTDVVITTPTNDQVLTYESATGLWKNAAGGGGGGGGSTPVGMITMFGGAAAPAGWLICDGLAIDRVTYLDLFNTIGTAYGIGDGSTTFNVPNLKQRFPLGKADAGTGAALGAIGGVIDHSHTVPAHSHAAGTLAVAAHSHDAGTYAVGSHTHAAGSYSIASHSHTLSAGTVSTVGTHAHGLGSHTHGPGSFKTVATIGGSISGTTGSYSHDTINYSSGGNTFKGFLSPNSHTHSFSASVSLPFDADLSGTSSAASGNTASDGSHTHTLSGSTGTSSPGLSGTSGASTATLTGNSGSVAPGLTGTVAADAGSTTSGINPPFTVVNFLIKT